MLCWRGGFIVCMLVLDVMGCKTRCSSTSLAFVWFAVQGCPLMAAGDTQVKRVQGHTRLCFSLQRYKVLE